MADYVIRATAAEGQIRAFAATTRDLTETARQAHNTSPVATAALGRLMTAGAITKAAESDTAVTRAAEKETRAGKLAEGHGQRRISSQCRDGRRSQLQHD